MTFTNAHDLAQQWLNDVWTAGKLDVLDELLAEEFVGHPPQDFAVRRNREEFKRAVQWYHQTFADPHWQLDDVIEAGDKIIIRCTGWATYSGGWLNIAARGQRTRECSIIIFRVQNGKVHELWFATSDLDVVHQLGATVTSAEAGPNST